MTLEVAQFVAMFLAAFYSAVALFYLMFAKLLKRKHQGQSMIHMGERYSRHWWNHLTFRLFASRFGQLVCCASCFRRWSAGCCPWQAYNRTGSRLLV